jgi:hypothetical protein
MPLVTIPRVLTALPILPLCLLLAACGVRFSQASTSNEFFKEVVITGERRAGAPMTAAVRIEQRYPMEVLLRCELRRGSEQVMFFGQEAVPAYPNGRPDVTPFPANFSYDFTVDQPGRYKFECFSPIDDDDYIIKEFDVGPGAVATTA